MEIVNLCGLVRLSVNSRPTYFLPVNDRKLLMTRIDTRLYLKILLSNGDGDTRAAAWIGIIEPKKKLKRGIRISSGITLAWLAWYVLST
jgi:hypothetical protein